MNIATRCKGLLLGGLLCLSTWALALPGPKDIEASVQAGQFDRAESQLREVLREKPTSARAHYELGQVLAREGRYFEAEQALRQAQKLEPSPQVRQLAAAVQRPAVQAAGQDLHAIRVASPVIRRRRRHLPHRTRGPHSSSLHRPGARPSLRPPSPGAG